MYSDFKIAIPITRAYRADNGDMMVEGIASSDSVDSYETVFNRNCQEGFAFQIERGIEDKEPIELEAEHLGDIEPMNCLGPVIEAQVTDNNQLRIVAKMDEDNPKAIYYFKKMTVPDPITKKTKQYGLSINGAALESHYEYRSDVGKNIRVFDKVRLKRIGIVRKPSNPDTWVEKLLRSVNWEEVQTQERNQMETQENVQRVEQWDAQAVLDAMRNMVSAMSTVECWVQCEKYENVDDETVTPEIQTGREALSLMKQVFAKMQTMLTYETQLESEKQMEDTNRASDTTNTAESQKEDLSDKVDTLRSEETPKVETEEVPAEAKTETEVEAPKEETEAAPAPEAGAEKPAEEVPVERSFQLDPAQISSLVDAVSAVFKDQMETLTRKMDEAKESSDKALEEVTRKLDEAEKTNQELVQRLAKVEALPATAPGGQLVEDVTRSQDPNTTKREENVQRAQKDGNASELIKFKMFGNKYLGNGEFI